MNKNYSYSLNAYNQLYTAGWQYFYIDSYML